MCIVNIIIIIMQNRRRRANEEFHVVRPLVAGWGGAGCAASEETSTADR